MAHDDRTEKPTPKRKKEARKQGNVAKSPDVSGWLVLLVGTVAVPKLYGSAEAKLNALMAQAMTITSRPSEAGDLALLSAGLKDAVTLVLPVACAFVVTGLIANVAQTGPVLSTGALKPKWSKLNPAAGLKRLVSAQSAWQLGKQVLKLVALVGVAYGFISGMEHELVGSQPADMTPVISYAGSQLLGMARDVAGLGLALGVGDWAWQRRRVSNSLKMTKQQVKDESRQSEGDPKVKGKIRQKQFRLSRSRMMAAVAGADVLVVNPTHFAVALRYDSSRGRAPVVVAKGVDELALRMREKAIESKVPVVEDPPLARAVYAACDIDEAIPPELFVAVARLLAFVYTLPPLLRRSGLVHRRPGSALVA